MVDSWRTLSGGTDIIPLAKMLPDIHVSTVLSTRFRRITLALAIIPLYYSLQFSKKIYGVLIETRGTTLADGTIVIPEHDNSQFPADEIVNADNVLPHYLRLILK